MKARMTTRKFLIILALGPCVGQLGLGANAEKTIAQAATQPPATDPRITGPSVTPFMAPQDINKMARIRQDLMNDATLSTMSQNIIVLVDGNRVTLKGAVATDRDRALVEAIARRALDANAAIVNETVVQSRQ